MGVALERGEAQGTLEEREAGGVRSRRDAEGRRAQRSAPVGEHVVLLEQHERKPVQLVRERLDVAQQAVARVMFYLILLEPRKLLAAHAVFLDEERVRRKKKLVGGSLDEKSGA